MDVRVKHDPRSVKDSEGLPTVRNGSPGVNMGLTDDHLKQKGARGDRTVRSAQFGQMIVVRVGRNELKKRQRQRGQEALTRLERVLCLLGVQRVVGKSRCAYGGKRHGAVLMKQAMISTDTGSINDRNSKNLFHPITWDFLRTRSRKTCKSEGSEKPNGSLVKDSVAFLKCL